MLVSPPRLKKKKKIPTPWALKQSWREINFVNVKTLDWNFPGSLRALAAQIPLQTYPVYSGQITETSSVKTAALAMWTIPWRYAFELRSALVWGCREGNSHLSKVTGDFLCALLDSAGQYRDIATPCKSGCSCSHRLPFRQLGRSVCSEKDVI